MSISRRQQHSRMRVNYLACGNCSPRRCWLPLHKQTWKCWLSVSFETHGVITCCTVAYARVVKFVGAYAKVCLLYRVTRHVALTYGRSMTNGATYQWGKLHHSPWHSDIRTSNQLNSWECTVECNQECTSEHAWQHPKLWIWQFGFKFVECSMMYSIKRTYLHAYHSNLVNAQVHRIL